MKNITIKSLAEEIRTSVDRLVQQFNDAGINKTAVDSVTQQEKEALLVYLNRDFGHRINKLTVRRKTRSTLNIPSADGKSRSIQIEVRKIRTYVQRDHQALEQEKYTDVKKAKHDAINHSKCDIAKQKKHVSHMLVDSTLLTQHKSNNVTKLLNLSETSCLRVAELTEHKRKSEEEKRNRVEAKSHKIAEEARHIAEKNISNWNTTIDIIDNDLNDYHITTSHHAREAEDENDRKVENERRSRISKITRQKKTNRISEIKADREEERTINRSSNQYKRKSSTLMHSFNKPIQVVSRNIIIGETITVVDLASKMAIKGSQVIKSMINLGVMATINQVLDQETAQIVAEEMGHKVILRRENALEESVMIDRNTGPAIAEPRAPVVTIMGHVDHGKTSLLDYIRSTKVAACEAGGITQHIGAYHVETDNGMITFIDTPGHAAFTSMRARGAQVTDIVVLVVAADDGVMPQTIEAIQHAKAANVPLVVAVNKIDKIEADPDRVKNELTQQYGIIPEEWGGESQFVNISAKYGTGIDALLDAILLQAELLELKATRNGMASGLVIESFLDKGRGPVATILVREGTLNCGDILLCGFEYGRVRAMRDELGKNVTLAGPSIPVAILGLSGVPAAGDEATVVRNEKQAREVALYRQSKFREIKLAHQQKSKLENTFTNVTEGRVSDLNIVLKSDVQGTVEAISSALENLSNNEVKVKIIGSGVGGITETDAILAAASNAILIGFNVRADAAARRVIGAESLDIRCCSVIYDLINEVKKVMSGILMPEYKRKIIGLAEVRDVFCSPKFGAVAGCMVTEGMVKRHRQIRVLRENIVIHEGELESLRRFKDEVNEVRHGMECGIGVKNYNDIRTGDMIEVSETIEIQRTITNA